MNKNHNNVSLEIQLNSDIAKKKDFTRCQFKDGDSQYLDSVYSQHQASTLLYLL